MTTTHAGVADTSAGFDPTDGEAAFLAHLLPNGDPDAGKQPSGEGDTEDQRRKKPVTQEAEDHDEPETDETSEETPEGEEADGDDEAEQKRYVEEDGETYTKIKVGDVEHEVPVSQLKRLFGQEASLTQKSQAVAAKVKEVEQQAQQYTAGLNALLAKAVERAKPYAELDFLALAKMPDVTAEQLHALRQEAQGAMEDVHFLQGELGNFVKAQQERQHADLVTTAKETVKTLSDPTSPLHIEGWSPQVYNEVRQFAIDTGLPAEIANNMVQAPALKLIHMAMLYQKGQKNVTTTKVNKTVKKVVKTSKTMPSTVRTGKGDDAKKAMARLKITGSQDDAEAAFLARFNAADEAE